MLLTALNHMTMPGASVATLMQTATSLGCSGVELRNDLSGTFLDGQSPSDISDLAAQQNLRILALAEVYGFNDNTDETRAAVKNLMHTAQACGADSIVLIPRIADMPVPRDVQRSLLRTALTALLPVLEDQGVIALIEPLGFANSTLRFKADVVAVLEELGRPDCFALVHDTFHHTLAGETAVFPEQTRIVHISGVSDRAVAIADMTDTHRGLVDGHDRLGNIAQIKQLLNAGYAGPFSTEAFAPAVHNLNNPTAALSASHTFITSEVTEMVA